jgi:hypothetical protein
MSVLIMFAGIVLIILGLVFMASRAGYLIFIVRPSTIVWLSVMVAIAFLCVREANAETNESFILNSFPHCAGLLAGADL